MNRASRAAPVIALLLFVAACGDDATPTAVPTLAPPRTTAASSEPAPDPSGTEESTYVEEDPDPSAAPGDLPDAAQSYLDQALETEIGALAAAGTAAAGKKMTELSALPEDPHGVLSKLAGYTWQSPEAKALYDKAVSTSNATPSASR